MNLLLSLVVLAPIRMNPKLLDALFTSFHLIIIGFNLLGWIWRPTRKLHFICVSSTVFCWFILGIWYGMGYCPLTDWQWQIKTKLGEHNLPDSFIKYFIDKVTGLNVNASLIDTLTLVCFLAAILCSVYVNFILKQKGRR